MEAEQFTKEKYREMYYLSHKRCEGLRAMAENVIAADKEIIIDAAFTGSDAIKDEIYKLSVIDIDGSIIYDSFFVPESYHSKFHIKDLSVLGAAPTLRDQLYKIDEILLSANTIIAFDLKKTMEFLRRGGCIWRTDYNFISLVTAFSEHCGIKEAALNDCAAYFGYKIDCGEVDTIEKCNMIFRCYNQMLEDKWNIVID